jgi:hypothetical protein
MTPKTTMTNPVHLTEPAAKPPVPHPGCDVCEALMKQWHMSMEIDGPAYDLSHATDIAAEIGRHPHGRKPR